MTTPTKPTAREIEAFFKRVRPSVTGCLIWTGTTQNQGYGLFYFNGYRGPAHRWAYRFFNGNMADGLVIDHLCRVKPCVQPLHLEAVESSINTLRGDGPTAQNATLSHCHKGHEFTPDNVLWRKNRLGRICRVCNYEQSRDWKRRARREGRLIDRRRHG